ncbi:MAG: hypothetical protein M1820_007340 [Bogoriella megaspora]|nr:MAG: hypothetical protein M1820_007340 [Bogoriella megaspora]
MDSVTVGLSVLYNGPPKADASNTTSDPGNSTSDPSYLWSDTTTTTASQFNREGPVLGKGVDIVALHGLNGHHEQPWALVSEARDETWLQKILPDYFPSARILSYGYCSQETNPDILTPSGLQGIATDLLEQLIKQRSSEELVLGPNDTNIRKGEDRTIVFLCDGFGGVLAKKALILARTLERSHSIADNTRAIVFFGTPHRVRNPISWEIAVLSVLSNTLSSGATDCQIPMTLSTTMRELSNDFINLCEREPWILISLYDGKQRKLLPNRREFFTLELDTEIQMPQNSCHGNLSAFSRDDTSLTDLLAKLQQLLGGSTSVCVRTLLSLCPTFSLLKRQQNIKHFLESETYLRWIDGQYANTLLLHGPPGTSKSCVSANLYRHLVSAEQRPLNSHIVYFSFDDSDIRRNSEISFLASFTRQLLLRDPSLFSYIENTYNLTTQSSCWTAPHLWSLLRSLLSEPKNDLVLIVNAIEKCDEEQQIFADRLFGLLDLSATDRRRKLLITSTEPGIRPLPRDCLELSINKLVDSTEAIIQGHTKLLYQERPFLQEFEDKISKQLSKAETTLRKTLILYQLRFRSSMSTPRDLRIQFESLIDDPEKITGLLLCRNLPTWAWMALSWIVRAKRPLACHELAVAAVMNDSTKRIEEIEDRISRDIFGDLQSLLHPFLELDNGRVRFSHGMFRDILITKDSSLLNPFGRPLLLTNYDIAKVCLVYMSTDEVRNWASHDETISVDPPTGGRILALLDYAVNYWPEHYRSAQHSHANSVFVHDYLSNSKNLPVWSGISWRFSNPVTRRNFCLRYPLDFAADLGIEDVVDAISSHRFPNHGNSDDYSLALNLACQRGSVPICARLVNSGIIDARAILTALSEPCATGLDDIVKLLLQHLSDSGSDDIEWSPSLLPIAVRNGHYVVVNELLLSGAPVDMFWEGAPPIVHAINEVNEPIAQLLLQYHANVNTRTSNGALPLHLACLMKLPRLVGLLISHQADINALDGHGASALHLAVEDGEFESVEQLLNAGADILARSSDQRTPLHLSSQRGESKVVKLIMAIGMDIDMLDDFGYSPLLLASQQGHFDVVKALLENGAKPDIANELGRSSLSYACESGNSALVEMLLESGASPDSPLGGEIFQPTPIYHAARLANDRIIEMLIEKRANVNVTSGSPFRSALSVAAQQESESKVKLLLDAGADFTIEDEDEKSALHHAAAQGSENIVRLLLDAGANVDASDRLGRTALHNASVGSIVEVLVRYGATVDKGDNNSRSPLCIAAQNGLQDVVKSLLGHGADVFWTDEYGDTPLHDAVYWGNDDVIDLLVKDYNVDVNLRAKDGSPPIFKAFQDTFTLRHLLELGAGPNLLAHNGRSALMVMADHHDSYAVQVLLEHGADVDALDANGNSALHFAAARGSIEAIEALLNANTSTLNTDSSSGTPLARAAEFGRVSVVEKLLEAGARIDFQDDHGNTALQYAVSYCKEETAALLIRKGAPLDVQDVDGDTALHSAVTSKSIGSVDSLLKAGASTNKQNKKGQTPLLVCVNEGHAGILPLLLAQDADLDAHDVYKRNVFHLACRLSKREILELLLPDQASISPEIQLPLKSLLERDILGCMPVYWAALSNVPGNVKLLLQLGTSWQEPRDKQGRTLIHQAASHYALPDLSELVSNVLKIRGKRPKELNAPDDDGWTPLHWACKNGNVGAVRLLLAAGADPVKPCRREWTPKLIAIFHGRRDVLKQLDTGRPRRGSRSNMREEQEPQSEKPITPVERVPSSLTSEPLSVEENFKVGFEHSGYSCDACNTAIFGVRFRCKSCAHLDWQRDYDLCFKCAWRRKSIHFGDHEWDKFGQGPEEDPFSSQKTEESDESEVSSIEGEHEDERD